jgi:pimeloyl-ACP methyl ester carboxylesterase
MSGAGTWSEETINGHRCDLYDPPVKNDHGYMIIYLHGVHSNRLVDKPRFCEVFDRFGMSVVAPHTQRSWWTDRICSEFDGQVTAERHLIDHVLPFVEERCSSKPPRIGLLGTSMGAQGGLRFSYKYPNLFPVVAAIAPAIDYHIRYDEDDVLQEMYPDPETARQDTALLHIHPLNWPRHQFFCCDPTDFRWWDSADRLRMKLWSLGVPHECDLDTTGGGHGFEYYEEMAEKAVSFVAERLEQERLRLV